MVVQRGKTFFVYLPAGPEKGWEELGKALEIFLRELTDLTLTDLKAATR
ncbi:hypothetical protein SAMN04488057_104204 [Cyclobacterium lianum]|uniref:Uncharacterized protein n=1 Tax=Cyclobacterium lianum TaxID=388280 RepID=A0A1M7MB89_9BACT|nr:hypothetical protein SAMN04488057_104204 [Cyclobacterium lianum]